ncbi:hypothetical protein COCOBI_14-1790 [Coccomyxa sp. Obi]|nr:hypothetical protein COCOBI_14-1790 [Coccomyxa sp. Obi]
MATRSFARRALAICNAHVQRLYNISEATASAKSFYNVHLQKTVSFASIHGPNLGRATSFPQVMLQRQFA